MNELWFSGIFEDWLFALKDRKARAIIRARLRRLGCGLAGVCKPVGRGVFELKIYYGPGYRIYISGTGNPIIVVLCGGNKSTQYEDIKKAQHLLQLHRQGILI